MKQRQSREQNKINCNMHFQREKKYMALIRKNSILQKHKLREQERVLAY